MLQPGKMVEIADDLRTYGVTIGALQEIRRKGHSIYYSCAESQGYNGVGFYVDKKVQKSVMVNERISYLRLKGKFQNITILSAYAPTEESEDDIKDKFYYKMSHICNKISRYDIEMLCGDFNVKIGKESTIIQQVAGKHSLPENCNDNGMRLCNFAELQALFISSTSFQHKRVHKQTWKFPGHNDN